MSAILLVEDSQTHMALMRSILESEGHAVECAEDGCEAIAAIEQAKSEQAPIKRAPFKQAPFDLVVTDLRMPKMNGNELVETIARDHPCLPTLVVTARGSESLAVDALALGAANFVPKNSIAKLLARTVRQTMDASERGRAFDGFAGSLERPELSMTFPPDLGSVEPAVLLVVQMLAATGYLPPGGPIRVGAAVRSAVLNAICFGILQIGDEDTSFDRWLSSESSGQAELRQLAATEPFHDRVVKLKVSIDRQDTRVLVSHNGDGKMARMTPAPGTPESFELEQCRGMMLMTSFMDDVIFRSGASEVVMVKKHVDPSCPSPN